MFEKASRIRLRFQSQAGQLTVEDLWDLPLTSNSGKANLDTMAVSLDLQLKDSNGTSFVHKKANGSPLLQLKFDIVKHIIDVRLAEQETATAARNKSEQKQKLLGLIAERQDADLRTKPLDELNAMVAALD